MFNATEFTYDDVYSGLYNLKIATFDGENVETSSPFAPTLTTAKASKSSRFFYGGIQYTETPQFEFSIVSQTSIPNDVRRDILNWLTGRKGFKKLQFHQPQFEDLYYKCIFTNADIIYVNGWCHGFTVTATFDSWYGYGKPIRKVVTSDGTASIELNISNLSDVIDDFSYPSIEFSAAAPVNGKNIVIENVSLGGQNFEFTNLATNEKINVDNALKIVTSNLGVERLENFNMSWLKLKQGINKLNVTINGTFIIECPTYELIGF